MKKLLREELLTQRNALSSEEVKEKSEIICQRIWDIVDDNIKTVMVYIPSDNETNIFPFINKCLDNNVRIVAPICGKNRTLIPSIIRDLDEDLALGTFDILAPKAVNPVPLEEIDLVIVPGVGFSPRGERLGFGAGYYDRFLPRVPNSLNVAVCYSLQIRDDIVGDEWDYPMDAVVTDDKVYWFKERK